MNAEIRRAIRATMKDTGLPRKRVIEVLIRRGLESWRDEIVRMAGGQR